jgi:RHS repeat-associated protein
VVYDDSAAGVSTRYFHKDHLGSTAVITNETGAVVEQLAYDAWGKRRHANGNDDPTNSLTSLTTRGFTGHEHLQQVGLVHMNGRVYDPLLGRFISTDPNVQDALDTQSLNRYSYVKNNPLAYTDPSGFFSLGKFFKKIFSNPIVRIVVAIVASVVIGPAVAAWASNALLAGGIGVVGATAGGLAAAGAVTGGIVGGLSGGLEGALRGALMGAVIGGVTGALSASYNLGFTTPDDLMGFEQSWTSARMDYAMPFVTGGSMGYGRNRQRSRRSIRSGKRLV